jgi:ATP-dependent Clp protease ATP-binding subunit ClpA
MTSNLGARDNESNTIGFGDLTKNGEDDKAVKQFFPPEFRNRLDAIVKFSSLTNEVVVEIVKKFIKELNDQLKDKSIEISLDKESINWLAEKGYDRKMGARPLSRLIDNKIKSPLSRRVLFGDLVNGGKVSVSIDSNDLKFVVSEISKPLTREKKSVKSKKAIAEDFRDENIAN